MDMVKCDRCGLIGKRDQSWGTVIIEGFGEPRVKYDTCSRCRQLIKDIMKEGIKVGELDHGDQNPVCGLRGCVLTGFHAHS